MFGQCVNCLKKHEEISHKKWNLFRLSLSSWYIVFVFCQPSQAQARILNPELVVERKRHFTEMQRTLAFNLMFEISQGWESEFLINQRFFFHLKFTFVHIQTHKKIEDRMRVLNSCLHFWMVAYSCCCWKIQAFLRQSRILGIQIDYNFKLLLSNCRNEKCKHHFSQLVVALCTKIVCCRTIVSRRPFPFQFVILIIRMNI